MYQMPLVFYIDTFAYFWQEISCCKQSVSQYIIISFLANEYLHQSTTVYRRLRSGTTQLTTAVSCLKERVFFVLIQSTVNFTSDCTFPLQRRLHNCQSYDAAQKASGAKAKAYSKVVIEVRMQHFQDQTSKHALDV